MRLQYIGFILTFFVCLVQASQWSPEDYEIFNLNDKIQQDLGDEVDFYAWLGLESGPKSTVKEITKAYRKISRSLHPDKYSGSSKKEKKQAEERFQRLSAVGNILRDQSLRRRYDYFYAKGFPKWKGTGYYYSKFRPGFFFTLFIIYVLVSVFHFVALKINRRQDFKRMATLISQVKAQAWGGSMIPPADGSDRKLTNDATGKTFVVKADGGVFLVDTKSDELISLDENDINTDPGFKDTLFYKGPCKFWNLTVGKLTGKTINTTVEYVNTKPQPEEEKKKPIKKKVRGNKIELPNGKVVYGRPGGARGRK
jgi:hypothetical protein